MKDNQKETKIIVLLLQKLKAEISRSPMAAEVLMEKLNDKGKVLQTLEEQLYQLTGIHAETHVSRTQPLFMVTLVVTCNLRAGYLTYVSNYCS